jgi:2-keto-4-pentenoate hydratase/2-oxohepta-3-ene-1,7-dioic acid hydratase in catechol pathway
MKLVTYRRGNERDRIGALIGQDQVCDLTGSDTSDPRFVSMQALIDGGPDAWELARACVAAPPAASLVALSELQLRAPLPIPAQFRDAMTFRKHIEQSFKAMARLRARMDGGEQAAAQAEEAIRGWTLPQIHRQQPVYYKCNRFNSAGTGEDIPWPRYSSLMDFELELACVIGKRGKDIDKAGALGHVFGFTIFNDFSARDAQGAEMAGMLGPAKGKDFDKANVFGPCITTLDEIGDPQTLAMTARVNGETWGVGNSRDMAWTFADLIAHISRDETLYPGEIIASGTVGDGCGLEHLRFLKPGDVVELEIEKIGVVSNRVVRQEVHT